MATPRSLGAAAAVDGADNADGADAGSLSRSVVLGILSGGTRT